MLLKRRKVLLQSTNLLLTVLKLTSPHSTGSALLNLELRDHMLNVTMWLLLTAICLADFYDVVLPAANI